MTPRPATGLLFTRLDSFNGRYQYHIRDKFDSSQRRPGLLRSYWASNRKAEDLPCDLVGLALG